MKSTKTEITKVSILNAITDGATSLTAISKKHGYNGSVSGSISAKIRTLVPDIASRLASKVVQPVAVQPVVKVVAPVVVQKPVKAVKAPAVAVAQRKETYRGLYGAVYTEALAAGEIAVKTFIAKATPKIISDPVYATAVNKVRAKVGDDNLIAGVTKAISFAIGVLRSPKHLSNMGRSKDICETRGAMQIVALES